MFGSSFEDETSRLAGNVMSPKYATRSMRLQEQELPLRWPPWLQVSLGGCSSSVPPCATDKRRARLSSARRGAIRVVRRRAGTARPTCSGSGCGGLGTAAPYHHAVTEAF